MKFDLNELESDDDLVAPPYVTRSTKVKSNDERAEEFSLLHPISANLMDGVSQRVGGKK